MTIRLATIPIVLALATPVSAQEEHHHPMPEHLGTTHLETSCAAAVAPAFDRAVALLHSFTYDQADMASPMSRSAIRIARWRTGDAR